MMPTYDEKAIEAARAAWREQDERTYGKTDGKSISTRRAALIDLLCAHVQNDTKEQK